MKTCVICGQSKCLEDFYRNGQGTAAKCKPCYRAYRKTYYKNNKDAEKTRAKKWFENNYERYRLWQNEHLRNKWRTDPDHRKRRKASNLKYYKKYYANKYKNDPIFKAIVDSRSKISEFIRGKSFKESFNPYIGCFRNEFILHIESKFEHGMTWDNYGEWHIDHIVPLSSAVSVEEVKELNKISNLQPLWAADNFKKGNKT